MINKKMLKVTILVLTFVQMATNGLSPAMSDIAACFPESTTSTVQFLMTLPGIFVVILSLTSAWLTSVFPKKYLIGTGSICICATALLGTVFHESLKLLFAWSALMGIGMGLISTLTVSLISDYFEGQEKVNLTGLQTSAANIGGMIMTAVGGVLTSIAWYYDYLVYLLAFPGLILLILFVPGNNPANPDHREYHTRPDNELHPSASLLKNRQIWMPVFISVVLLFLFNAGPTNLSMYATEFAIGNSIIAGWAATFFLLGGTLMGIAFGFFSRRLGSFTIPLGFCFMAAGFFILLCRPNTVCLFTGCLLAGMSISLVSPQCILQASKLSHNAREAALAAALIMAGSNVGTFLAPQITNIAALISGSESTRYRFIFVIFAAVVMIVFTFILSLMGRKKYGSDAQMKSA